MSRREHVSEGLARTQHIVVLAAVLIALCAAAQMLVFGFVHFTDVRWTEVQVSEESRPLHVVGTPDEPMGRRALEELRRAEAAAVEVNRVLTPADGVLRQVSSSATTVGVMAATGLVLVSCLGVLIAAGGSVPGVGRAVSAAMWAMVLAMGCVPWRDVLPSVPFGGVFSGYDAVCAASALAGAGQGSVLALMAQHALMPLAAMACAIVVALRYREGVSQGIIVESVSELDAQVEREIARIREQGPSSGHGVRTVGALNRAIGSTEAGSAAAADPDIPAPRKGRGWVSANDRRIGQPSAGEGLKRPI